MRIPVDYVAGTSIGSIIAGLYATGLSPDEMEKILKETDWDAALEDNPSRKEISYRRKEDDDLYLIKAELGFSHGKMVLPTGLLAGEKLGILLRKFTLPFSEVRDFDCLPIPYRAVAADLATGDPVVLSKGDIARCMRASMAIAGFFSPVELDGKLLTDGGAARNLPVDVVRAMGADIVIAIDISTPLEPQDKLTNLFAITNQTIGFLTRLNVLRSIETLGPRDVLIAPNLEGIGTTNFAQFPLAIPRGTEAAEKAADALRALSVSEEEYALFLKKQRYPHPTPNVDAVKVLPIPGVDPRVVEARVDYTKKGPVDWNEVDRTLGNIYELNDFSTVDFRIIPVDGVSTLVIEPRPKTPAPTRVRFGLLLNTDFSGSSAFALRASVNKTQMNALRGEWKTQIEVGLSDYLTTQWYQPLDYAGRFFVMPAAGIQRQPFNLFVDQTADRALPRGRRLRRARGRDLVRPARPAHRRHPAGLVQVQGEHLGLPGSRFHPEPDGPRRRAQSRPARQRVLSALGLGGERAVHLGRERPRGRLVVQQAHRPRRVGDESFGVDARSRRQRHDEDRQERPPLRRGRLSRRLPEPLRHSSRSSSGETTRRSPGSSSTSV